MLDAVRRVLAEEPRVAFAMVFGSRARGTARDDSDLDVAIGLGEPLDHHDVGELVSRLEEATGRTVDLVLLDEAPPELAHRVFRDGVVVLEREPSLLIQRRARAILDYLDFRPLAEILARGVLEAAKRG